ncbi:hypothetical protein CDD80_6364 [Ophiocordyceps camponoti-rufipedis]|uniref:Uncharacterized protein n=1 Tax=Ophiocordyceps camponoti-rufipedis TaxID=2004952 RepID=A0A2C5XSR9_9HYPO|nr:hypothetical protein CDD80_6364 [Ophiocordyceps camponoti-rufipedis]
MAMFARSFKGLWRSPTADPVPAPARRLTLRIHNIPIETTLENLRDNLKRIASRFSALKGTIDELQASSLVRCGQRLCATVSFSTVVPEAEILRLLQGAGEYPYEYDFDFYGITPLHEDVTGVEADIVAVPGLASHAIGSWRSRTGNDVWLRDFLPEIPKIRVLLYGYNTKLLESDSRQSISNMGRKLLEEISSFRSNDSVRDAWPALVASHYSSNEHNSQLSQTCCGLVFFGVPNFGLRHVQLQL